MGILTIVLLVFFIIIAVLLVLLVLIQNDESGGLGGMFGGGSNTAFGSRSGNVLTKATTFLGTMFLIASLGLALLSSRAQGGRGVLDEAQRMQEQASASSFSAALDAQKNYSAEELTDPTLPDYDEETEDSALIQ